MRLLSLILTPVPIETSSLSFDSKTFRFFFSIDLKTPKPYIKKKLNQNRSLIKIMYQTYQNFLIYSILIIFLFNSIQSSIINGRSKKLLPRCERLMILMSSIPSRNQTQTRSNCKENKEFNLFQQIKSLQFDHPTFNSQGTLTKPYITLGNQYSDRFEIRALYTSSGLKMCFEPLLDEINSKDPAVFLTI
ncbi:hypothetical protein DFH28DRAFT_279617 [Melampsora americana]|nr:hypothetical protein DFH28DRAFT_279617 [Melampsora americana]